MNTLRMKENPLMIVRLFLSELIGTILLAATASVAIVAHLGLITGYTSLYIPFAVGSIVMVLVYLLGSVSGAHFNPAVTLGLFTFRKMSVVQFVSDIIAQFLGAFIGVKLAIQLAGVAPSAPFLFDKAASTGEFVGAFLLVFAVMSVVLGRVKGELGGIVIGAALMIGITLSMITGGGILNPAIATALGTPVNVTFFLMPLLGGLVGAAIAVLFNNDAIAK